MRQDKGKHFILLRRSGGLLRYLFLLTICLMLNSAYAGDNAAIKGIVQDTAGQPLQNAEIYLYRGSNIRGTADFISPKTDSEGKYFIVVPRGRYWAVARVRQSSGGQFGPLMARDKHSGDAVAIELTQGVMQVNFTVADLKEAAAMSGKKTNENTIAIRGRILDRKGTPVKAAYAFANRTRQVPEIPDYLSSWVDEEGHYTLFLPRGNYFLGFATVFPPGTHAVFYKEITVDDHTGTVDILTPDK